jgi:hypothetical protein
MKGNHTMTRSISQIIDAMCDQSGETRLMPLNVARRALVNLADALDYIAEVEQRGNDDALQWASEAIWRAIDALGDAAEEVS